MAQPITWQTVTGPSLAEASRPMEAASRSFNEAFSGLDNVLKQRQAIEAGNWDQTKLNNTNALLGAVQEPKTPEEFAAKEAQLRQMLTGYGAQVDPIAARAALDGRMATLQQRGLANIQYTGAVAEEADRPKRDLALSLYAQGNFAGGDAVAAEVQRNKAALYEASRLGQRRVITEGQADTTFSNNQEIFGQTKLLMPGQKTLQDLSIANQRASLENTKLERDTRRAEKAALVDTNSLVNQARLQDVNRTKIAQELAAKFRIPIDPETGNIMPSRETGQTMETVRAFEAELERRAGPRTTPSQTIAALAKQLSGTTLPVDKQNSILEAAGRNLNDADMLAPADGLKKAALEEKLKAAKEQAVKNNPWYGAELDKTEGITRVLKQTDGQKDFTWYNIPKNFKEFMTEGFNHNGKKVVIPPKVLEQALAEAGGMQKDSTLYNDTLSGTEAALKRILDDPNTAKLREQAGSFDSTINDAKAAFIKSLKLPANSRTLATSIDDFYKKEEALSATPKK